MEEKIKYNISYLEYKFALFNTITNIGIYASLIILDIICNVKTTLFPDIIRLAGTLIGYLFIFMPYKDKHQFNLKKLFKIAISVYISSMIFSYTPIIKYIPSLLYEVLIFIPSLLFFYTFNRAFVYSMSIILIYPLGLGYSHFYSQNILINNHYIELRTIFTFLCIVLVASQSIYFLVKISIQKAILHYIQTNEIHVDKFLWFKFDLVTEFSPKETVSSSLIPSHEKLFRLIENYMKKEKPWLDPEYSAEQLARELKTNILYISQAINTCAKTNFKSYLNEFRLFAFINELKKVKQDKVSLKEIYLNVGFHNQATFNRVFKNRFNMTPQEYMENIADSVDE